MRSRRVAPSILRLRFDVLESVIQACIYEASKTTLTDPVQDLRDLWTAEGVPTSRQDELIAQIAAKAAPGAQIGPFRLGVTTNDNP